MERRGFFARAAAGAAGLLAARFSPASEQKVVVDYEPLVVRPLPALPWWPEYVEGFLSADETSLHWIVLWTADRSAHSWAFNGQKLSSVCLYEASKLRPYKKDDLFDGDCRKTPRVTFVDDQGEKLAIDPTKRIDLLDCAVDTFHGVFGAIRSDLLSGSATFRVWDNFPEIHPRFLPDLSKTLWGSVGIVPE